MSKFKSRWLDLSDPYIFTGNVEVPSPSSAAQAANKQYVDSQIATLNDSKFKSSELTYADTTNKVLALPEEVDASSSDLRDDIVVIPIGGTLLDYGIDYTIRLVGSQAYICFATDSTAPSASFDGGDASNPSTGIDSLLNNGDTIKVMYPSIGSGGGGSSSSAENRNWFLF